MVYAAMLKLELVKYSHIRTYIIQKAMIDGTVEFTEMPFV